MANRMARAGPPLNSTRAFRHPKNELVMAGGAVTRRLDALLSDPFQVALHEVRGLRIPHRRDFVVGAKIELGLAMALQTPPHRERFFLVYDLHLVDSPVTGLTPNALVHVGRVAKVGIIGKVVHLRPLNGLVVGPALPHPQQIRRIRPNLVVTVHTRLRRRHVGVLRVLDVGVAVLAVDAKLTGVKLVTVRHRLIRLIPNGRKLWREVVPDQHDQNDPSDERPHEREEGKDVGLLGKYLRHTNAAVSSE